MNLLDSIRACCVQLDERNTCWIAYSGGMDSHVLLSLCHQLRLKIKINFRAIHINHGISPHAKAWSAHCKKICDQYQIEYLERCIQLDLQPGDSLEAVAREKRYAIFAEYTGAGDVLLTAHHQDDQAETVLLQLLRGAGPKGLAAMPVSKAFAEGYHARPLLAFSRATLRQYADENNLQWIEDESNQDVSLSRNFIRHEILPALMSRWPSAAASIARSARHCAENQRLLEHGVGWAERFSAKPSSQPLGFAEKRSTQPTSCNTLSVAALLQLDPEKQKLILRTFIHQSGFPLPTTKKLDSILHNVLQAAWDKSPLVEWGNVMLRRHRDDIYLLRKKNEPDVSSCFDWEIEKPLALPHGVLKTGLSSGKGLRADIRQVSVRFRQGGEMLEMKGRGRRSLKNLLQEWQVLPWERSSLPLIFVENQLIAIAGYFLHADFMAGEDEAGREIVFESKGKW